MKNPQHAHLIKSFRIAKPLNDDSFKLTLWRITVSAVADTLAELDSEFERMGFLLDCEYHKD